MKMNFKLRNRHFGAAILLAGLALAIAAALLGRRLPSASPSSGPGVTQLRTGLAYQPRHDVDTAGYLAVQSTLEPYGEGDSLEDISRAWQRVGFRGIESIDQTLAQTQPDEETRLLLELKRAAYYNYEGEPKTAYRVLTQLRSQIERNQTMAQQGLYSVIYAQGVTALRRGENENCILCRGESSCIIPISSAAIHTNPEGSRLAIEHFTEYLEMFPDDLDVRWLLNIAHMTLGEHPQKVDRRYLVNLDRFTKSEFDIGVFRDIGHLVGVNRLNHAGGGIMEDFDNDGLLDIATTTVDATGCMAFYHNTGRGIFEECAASAGLADQLGGLYCVQTDYNNDGYKDIFVVRGAWYTYPQRPSLLRNNANGTFTDVTAEAGVLHAVNSISASWADYDNDGWLDLFICCERQPSRLYHNLRDGTFEEVAREARVDGGGLIGCKGSAWIDYDNDGYQDLFLNYLVLPATTRLYHNDHDGRFTDVTLELGLSGPAIGFSCWAWDYDNDGWLDLFATSYDKAVGDMVKGLLGEHHQRNFGRLYHNRQGRRFEDKTREAGLDMVFAAMGSNFGDFDNDGFLDFYLGTGDPDLSFLAPNRMFKNVGGRRFAEITGTSRTGNLQKGHGVACGDWDRDGDVDLFIEMGGAINGDRYHNILFQNPGQGNHWLTVKLVGQKTNRAAIGARIKVVTAGKDALTVYRHVSSGSSFGANPLEQTIGLAKSDRVAILEVHWPTSGTTQVFRDLAVDQAVEITEFAEDYRRLDWNPIAVPK